MNILLSVSFIGKAYCGWQVQNNAVSVQETLQKALKEALGGECPLTGCSRTDAGVHANQFCCTVRTDGQSKPVPLDKLPEVVNFFLPKDIAVKSARIVPDSFHPRYDVIRKEYLYRILNTPIRDPFCEGLVYRVPKKLDEEKMAISAVCFLGKHDFSACMASGSDIIDCVRTVDSLRVTRKGDEVDVVISADGFLYNMVRIIVGTLIEVSHGKIDPSSLPERISSKDRSRMGFTAPACGLYLNRVEYGNF